MDLFTFRLSAQLPWYIAWKQDPYNQGTDAIQQIWSNRYLYAFQTFSMISKVLRKIDQDQVKRTLIVAPTWQSQKRYQTLLRMSVEKPLILPHTLPGSDTSITKISSLDSSRQRLLAGGIWERASELISSTRRQGSLSNYDLSWSKSTSCCGGRNTDSFWCAIGNVLDYLSYLFDSGLQHRTIGCHRSAISAYHEYVDTKPVG